MVSPDYHEWMCKLLGHDLDIEYKLCFKDIVAGAISRVTTQSIMLSFSIPCIIRSSSLDQEIAIDSTLSQFRQALSQG